MFTKNFFFLFIVATYLNSLFGAETPSFEAQMRQLSRFGKQLERSEDPVVEAAFQKTIKSIIKLKRSTNSRSLTYWELELQHSNVKHYEDRIAELASAIARHEKIEELRTVPTELFDKPALFMIPFHFENGLHCSLLEYALYHNKYKTFDCITKMHETLDLHPQHAFLIGLLQHPEKAEFINFFQQSNKGHIRLASLLNYAILHSLYHEAWMLLSRGVSPNSLNLQGSDIFIIEAAARKNDIVAVKLLLNAGAYSPYDDQTPALARNFTNIMKIIFGLQRNEITLSSEESIVLEKKLPLIIQEIKTDQFRQLHGLQNKQMLEFLDNQKIGLEIVSWDEISKEENETRQQHEASRLEFEQLSRSSNNLDALEESVFRSLYSDWYRNRHEKGGKKFFHIFTEHLKKISKTKSLINGRTFLEWACLEHEDELIEWLLSQNTQCTARALLLAANLSDEHILSTQKFYRKNKPNQISHDPKIEAGRTPLEVAIEKQLKFINNSYIETINCLIEHGARLTDEKYKEYLMRIKKLGLNHSHDASLEKIFTFLPYYLMKSRLKRNME